MIAPEQVAALAEQDFAVFPIQPNAKKPPAIPEWEQRASADPAHVLSAWRDRWPGYNVGVACRRSLVVIDLDCHGDLPADWRDMPGIKDGRDVFAQLLEWAGQPWPVTRWASTPSGGWHLWFRAPAGGALRNTAGALGPGVDTRASGGYIVAPPSTIGGRAYEWLDDRPPAPLPDWLCRRLRPQEAAPASTLRSPTANGPANLSGLIETVRTAQAGNRTDPLVWAAHRLRDEIAAGRASRADGELLVQAACEAGIRGGERYARGQVQHVLGGAK